MNIANIIALTRQLESLDFKNISYLLLKKMSFKPKSFSVLQKIENGSDLVHFCLFFEKDNHENVYSLVYYDAVLQKGINSNGAIISGVNTADLERSMKDIDWKNAFNFNIDKQINLEDKTSWEREQKVESVIESLLELEKSEEGKRLVMGFKLKYWAGVPYQEVFGNLTPLKNKSEVSQRFYFSEGQTGISVDEACRFLQNRWLEREILVKRKQTEKEETFETADDVPASPESKQNGKRIANKAKVR